MDFVIERTAVDPHSSPVAEKPWDGAAAVNRLREWSGVNSPDATDAAWAKYREGFAWYDSSAPTNFGSYKLPHHDIVDGRFSLVRQGLFAAGAVVNGARGGVDIPASDMPGVRSHLARHYHDLELKAPWEAEAQKAAEQVIQKPFPNEHAARQVDPAGFDRFRRVHPDGFPDGVDVIFGFRAGGGSEIQSVRFDSSKWTPVEAKKWLADHNMKTGLEEATGKVVKILCAAEEKRIIYAVAMEPDAVDAHGDFTKSDEVEKASHRFMLSRTVGIDHEQVAPAVLVENYIAPVDLTEMHGTKLETPVKRGSWVVGMYIASDHMWDARNEITGVSIGGRGVRVE